MAHSDSPFWILAIHSLAAEALDVMEEFHASTARQLTRSVVAEEVPLLGSYRTPGGHRSTLCAMPVCTSIWRARAIEKMFLAAVRIASRSSVCARAGRRADWSAARRGGAAQQSSLRAPLGARVLLVDLALDQEVEIGRKLERRESSSCARVRGSRVSACGCVLFCVLEASGIFGGLAADLLELLVELEVELAEFGVDGGRELGDLHQDLLLAVRWALCTRRGRKRWAKRSRAVARQPRG